ncbi:MAG: hypothetical protein WAP51_02280, partial [Candidatus Sungiibacteriota bacterium]
MPSVKTIAILLVAVWFFVAAPSASAALTQDNFWFRDDDGTESGATGLGSGDYAANTAVTNIAGGTAFRLRLGIKATSVSENISPRIEFKQGSDCTTGIWTVITSSTSNFSLNLSSNFNDGAATTKQITSGQFTAGKILESTNPASSLSLSANRSTEYEWSLKAAATNPLDTTYAFRVTNNGTALTTYSQ